ncbi:MAG: hypothetical protein JNM07_08525 [Phycisphaerae bacterium]|nr:hypothetical protein [Phycisphaerae bacterium]
MLIAVCLSALSFAGPMVCASSAPPAWWLDERVREVAGPGVSLSTIGSSREGRPLHLIRIGATPDAGREPDAAPALLIVAGLHPGHRVGMETVLGVAKAIAANPNATEGRILYVVPCLNPDSAAWLDSVRPARELARTLEPDDADRDRRSDEDGPIDLNGDGMITTMRVKNPDPLSGLAATHLIDEKDPRLMRRADRAKGERPTHALLIESTDSDGDGRFGEDGIGGVELSMNFPHRWPEFRDGAGRYALDQPESLALARWMLGKANLAAVLVFDPRDNLLNVPPSGATDKTGSLPAGIEAGDKGLYEEVARVFKEITSITGAAKSDDDGSLSAWAYTQLGLPCFSTPVWVRPDLVKKKEPPKPDEKKDDAKPEAEKTDARANAEPGHTPAGETSGPKHGDHDEAGLALPGGQGQQPDGGGEGRGRGRGPGRGGTGGGGPAAGSPGAGEAQARDEAAQEDAKWLKYVDDRRKDIGADATAAQAGFVEWAAFAHPKLGEVEIGGFVPGLKLNPTAGEVARLVDEQTRFASDLLSKLPRLVKSDPRIESLGGGVYRVSFVLSNEGYFPTATAIAQKLGRLPPVLARIEVPQRSILSGAKVQRSATVAGLGGTFSPEWIITGKAGDRVRVKFMCNLFGAMEHEFTLPPAANGKEAR